MLLIAEYVMNIELLHDNSCDLSWGVVYFFASSSIVLACFIGFDRLMSKWRPLTYTILHYRYRYGFVVISYLFAGFFFCFFTLDTIVINYDQEKIYDDNSDYDYDDNCHTPRLRYSNYFTLIVQGFMTCILTVLYVIIPCTAQIVLKICFNQARGDVVILIWCRENE